VAHKLSWFSTDHVGVLLAKIKKKIPKIPTDGWLSQHQLGFLSVFVTVLVLGLGLDVFKCLHQPV